MWSFLKRSKLSLRQETAVEKTLKHLRQQRRSRFRILACVDDSEQSYDTVRLGADLMISHECDLIILHVRPIDQGLHSGGFQVRLARQNMIEAGFELPGARYLKTALTVLKEAGIDTQNWKRAATTQSAWGDTIGDSKVEYKSLSGQAIVLKLKTAPDIVGGILDQYELGPYNLIILGEPSRWRGELNSLFDAGIVQQVNRLAPCSVLVERSSAAKQGVLIWTDGTSRSLQAIRRAAVLAVFMQQPITLLAVARSDADRTTAETALANAQSLLKALHITIHETRLAVGQTAAEIVKHGADYKLIVVTDEGRSRLQRLIRGSTASEVVRHAATSVLTVR